MRSAIFNALFWTVSAIFALTCYALSFLPARQPLANAIIAYGRSVRWLMAAIAGIRIEVRGRPPAGERVIVAAKHQSYADGILMTALLGDLNFVIGNGIEKFPLVNRIVRKAGATMVNAQGNAKESAMGALDAAIARSFDDHRPVLIYPEGGLAAVGETRRYRKGVAMFYAHTGRPVVPVATNLGLLWQQEDWHKSPGTAVIEFLEPIETGLTRPELMSRLQIAIETRTRALEAEGRAGTEPRSSGETGKEIKS